MTATPVVTPDNAVITDEVGIVSPSQDVIPADLRTAWNKAMHEVSLAEKQAEKAVRRMQVGRVAVARVLVAISEIPALCKKNGSINQSALADALGIHKTQVSHYFKGIKMWQSMVASGQFEQSEVPCEAEIEAINTHWHNLANKARQARLGKNVEVVPAKDAPKTTNEGAEVVAEATEAIAELEVTAPTVDELFIKLGEVAKLVAVLQSANVSVSQDDADKFEDAIAELSASVSDMVVSD